MNRVVPAFSASLLAVLVITLLVFGALADRALVGQAEDARRSARDGADETARLTALTVRATLAQVEQEVASERPTAGVAFERLAIPPARLPPFGAAIPYGQRSRSDLVALLDSTRVTEGGLPEAVVARIALGDPPVAPLDAKKPLPDVAERLLSGRLPVSPEDLPHLAHMLGIAGDSRVRSLQERLRRAPEASRLPALPEFRRALTSRGSVEAWSRGPIERLRYEIPVDLVLKRAGVLNRAALSQGQSPSGDARLRRIVPVPDVESFFLSVALDVPGGLRLRALRASLWVAILLSCLGLVAVRRALHREAHALSRERRFLAGVTHELRTPLTAIRLLGETLAEGRGDAREYGTLVARESEKLEALVERVLAITRVEEAVRFFPVRPSAIVSSALALIAPHAALRSVELVCDEAEVPGEANWDADAVRRALLNMLDNAVTHGHEGGRVEVFLESDAHLVKIGVRDDGPGIGGRSRKGLFERFHRGMGRTPGTGLGLYLVDQVALAHGGRVDLVTEEGKGATFTLVLPRVPPALSQLPNHGSGAPS